MRIKSKCNILAAGLVGINLIAGSLVYHFNDPEPVPLLVVPHVPCISEEKYALEKLPTPSTSSQVKKRLEPPVDLETVCEKIAVDFSSFTNFTWLPVQLPALEDYTRSSFGFHSKDTYFKLTHHEGYYSHWIDMKKACFYFSLYSDYQQEEALVEKIAITTQNLNAISSDTLQFLATVQLN